MIQIINARDFLILCYIKKSMGILRQIAEYLYLKKPDPNQEKSDFMKYMNGINRISIFVFLFAMIVLLVRWVILPMFK